MQTYEKAIANARIAENDILNLTEVQVNDCLREVGNSLINNIDYIIKENNKDLERAKLIGADTDSLTITAEQIREIAHLYFDFSTKKSVIGIKDGEQITTPVGVIAILFERKPKVIATAMAYIIKSQSVLIACGGRELENTNLAFVNVIRAAIKSKRINEDICQGLALTSNSLLLQFIADDLDLIIPIGDKDFTDIVSQRSASVCLKTAEPMPYVYIDKEVNAEEVAKQIIMSNVKKILIHKDIYEAVMALLKGKIGLIANPIEYDFDVYNSLHKTAVAKIKNCAEAVKHINKYTNRHTDIIFSNDEKQVEYFKKNVRSVNVLANSLDCSEPITIITTVISRGSLSGQFTYDKLVSYKENK